jgi:hypothetical protein
MRRSTLLLATSLIAVSSGAGLVSSAQAQQGDEKTLTRRTDAEKRRDAEIDQQYRAVTRRSGDPGPAVKSDPWGNVRNQPSHTTKTSKK